MRAEILIALGIAPEQVAEMLSFRWAGCRTGTEILRNVLMRTPKEQGSEERQPQSKRLDRVAWLAVHRPEDRRGDSGPAS
jgi:hypothetical protein